MELPITDDELFKLCETLPIFSFSAIQKKRLIYPCQYNPNRPGIQLRYSNIRLDRQRFYCYIDLYEAKLAWQYKGYEKILSEKRLSEHVIMTSGNDKCFKPIFKEMIQNEDGNYECELSSFELIKTSAKGENKRKMLKRKYAALQEYVRFLGNDLTDKEVNIRIDNSVSIQMRSSQDYNYVCFGVHICQMNNGKFERVNGPFYSDLWQC